VTRTYSNVFQGQPVLKAFSIGRTISGKLGCPKKKKKRKKKRKIWRKLAIIGMKFQQKIPLIVHS